MSNVSPWRRGVAGAWQARGAPRRPQGSRGAAQSPLFPRWVSVLQNSKEEALNNAFKGDDSTGENNIVQELTKDIISEVQRMTGNDVCCDCGAPGDRPLAPAPRRLKPPQTPELQNRVAALPPRF